MKKLLFMSIVICSSFTLFSQEKGTKNKPTDKGNFIVDGSVNFSTNNSKSVQNGFNTTESSNFGFGINPKAAYFVVDRLALGLETSFGYFDNEFIDNNGTKFSSNSTSITIGPFLRYYLVNGLFGQASLGFGKANSENEGIESESDFFSYQFGLGYAFFLNKHISLEPTISYQYRESGSDQSTFETTNNGFILGAGFTIYL
ncbi:outer membrane beta-barrel protein [Polaribacter sp. HL-MS24]|uniref:outer membrane beta-barrel protein n=1 Tax=Polaribacter sp. HL-MS24 TaxID=3077735 RepID=UPI00293518E7|nr:outer membrane beta-barrel protein [Polaribacter sp. HL-MS24]WOC39949.1 outer membrane beta-barrel protein [Polaribacter sp. HL-MS24]